MWTRLRPVPTAATMKRIEGDPRTFVLFGRGRKQSLDDALGRACLRHEMCFSI